MVLLKLGYALIKRTGPSFLDGRGRHIGIGERMLAVTLVLKGVFLLIPIVAQPRLILHRGQLNNRDRRTLYLFELVVGVTLALVVGLALRSL
jgi:hypothetical protein